MIRAEREEYGQLVMAVIAKQLEVPLETVTSAVRFAEDLHADLLGIAELALALEATFDIEIPDDEWLEVSTVDEAIRYVRSRIEGRTSQGRYDSARP